jgi:hypothetical protein
VGAKQKSSGEIFSPSIAAVVLKQSLATQFIYSALMNEPGIIAKCQLPIADLSSVMPR